jgi:aspartate carbamoyltransferase catalytic subunit
MKHLISVNDLDHQFISEIMSRAQEYKQRRQYKGRDFWDALSNRLKNRLLITDFFEPSTRTRLSFEAAMLYMGGNVIGTENAAEFSSFKKGESIADNFHVISGYGDIIVGRFLNEGDAHEAANASLVPLINGGDGKGEHPTQALIDLFSIVEKFPDDKAENLRVTFLGDNKYSRTVQSLARLLARFACVSEINFIGPEEVNSELTSFLFEIDTIAENHDHRVTYRVQHQLSPETIGKTDIVYITRSQTERHYFKGLLEGDFVFTTELADLMPEHGLILHPLPRNSELPVEVDDNPRAYYFEQARNGLFVRMALLEALCLT